MKQQEYMFISYSHFESDFALKLAADLKNAGITVWMDRLEEGIQVGDSWAIVLERAINNSSGLIAILSPEYVKSRYCRNELARADTLHCPILPILLQRIPQTSWPIEIQRTQYLSFEHWRDEKQYQATFAQFLERLSEFDFYNTSDVPDAESRYLNSLIAELEARKGVLEYVTLSGQVEHQEEQEERPNPYQQEWATGFSLLFTQTATTVTMKPEVVRHYITDVQTVIGQYPKMVLVGTAGAGKTTTMRRMALTIARQRQVNPRSYPLPLVLYLPSWKSHETIEDFIRSHWPFQTDAIYALQHGEVYLFLDGLNEMGAASAQNAAKLRSWLQSPHAPKQILITSRADDYTGELDMGLPVARLEEMSDEHISQFVYNYLGNRADDFLSQILPIQNNETPEKADDFATAERQLLKLARNPYLLTALIFVYDNIGMGQLPRNTGALSRGLVNALWERERQRNTSGWVDAVSMERNFSKLAFAMIADNMPIDVSQQYAISKIDTRGLLHAGFQAHFVEARGEQIRFYHQLIQEYFAAVEMQQLGYAQYIQPIMFVLGRRTASKWDQVVIALCGIVLDASEIVAFTAERDPYLAVQCIISGAHVEKAIVEQVVMRVLALMNDTNARIRKLGEQCMTSLGVNAVSALLRSLDSSSIPHTTIYRAVQLIDTNTALPRLLEHIHEPGAIERLAQIRSPVAHTILIELFRRTKGEMAQKLARILDSRHWKPETDEERVRLYVLTRNWMQLSNLGDVAIPALLEIMRDDNPANYRDSTWAMVILANMQDTAVIPALIECLHEPKAERRQSAIRALAEISDARATEGLIQTLNDSDITARVMAATALNKRGWSPGDAAQTQAFYSAWLMVWFVSKSNTDREQSLKYLLEQDSYIPDSVACKQLVKHLPNETGFSQAGVITLLGRTGDLAYLSVYLRLLEQNIEGSPMRDALYNALEKLPREALLGQLAAALLKAPNSMQRAIAALLKHFGWNPNHQKERLLFGLMTNDWNMFHEANQLNPSVLANYLERQESPNLIALLQDITPHYHPALDESLEILKQHPDASVRAALVTVARSYSSDGGVKLLIGLLRDELTSIRNMARDALLSMPNVAARLVAQLPHETLEVQVVICNILGETRAKIAESTLIELIQNATSYHVIQASAEALGQIRSLEAVPIFEKILYTDRRVHKTILFALKRIGTPEAYAVISRYNVSRNPS